MNCKAIYPAVLFVHSTSGIALQFTHITIAYGGASSQGEAYNTTAKQYNSLKVNKIIKESPLGLSFIILKAHILDILLAEKAVAGQFNVLGLLCDVVDCDA